jgi:hypothetical protein
VLAVIQWRMPQAAGKIAGVMPTLKQEGAEPGSVDTMNAVAD